MIGQIYRLRGSTPEQMAEERERKEISRVWKNKRRSSLYVSIPSCFVTCQHTWSVKLQNLRDNVGLRYRKLEGAHGISRQMIMVCRNLPAHVTSILRVTLVWCRCRHQFLMTVKKRIMEYSWSSPYLLTMLALDGARKRDPEERQLCVQVAAWQLWVINRDYQLFPVGGVIGFS